MDADLSGQRRGHHGRVLGDRGGHRARAARSAGAAVALAARRLDRIEALAQRIRQDGGHGDRRALRRGRGGAGAGVRAARPRRARPHRRARQQRRRDAARADRGRAHRGMAADDPRERLRGPLLHPRGAAADARAGIGAHRQRELRRRALSRARARASTTSRSSVWAPSRSPCARSACRSACASRSIEPGAVATELAGHNRPEVLEQIGKRFGGFEPLAAEDIANAILYAIGQPSNVSINELLVRPSGQAG